MGAAVKIGVIMGSQSDWETMRHAAETLEKLGISHGYASYRPIGPPIAWCSTPGAPKKGASRPLSRAQAVQRTSLA